MSKLFKRTDRQTVIIVFVTISTICQVILKTSRLTTVFIIVGSMMVELHDAVEKLESWQTGKAVIIHGADHTFCSGGDLNLMKVHVYLCPVCLCVSTITVLGWVQRN